MSGELTATPRHLKACEELDIRDGQGLRVKSLRGVLWITQSNNSEDIVVRDGHTFVLDRPGLALISALIGPGDIIIQRTAYTRIVTACRKRAHA
jgi:hypothetical protein